MYMRVVFMHCIRALSSVEYGSMQMDTSGEDLTMYVQSLVRYVQGRPIAWRLMCKARQHACLNLGAVKTSAQVSTAFVNFFLGQAFEHSPIKMMMKCPSCRGACFGARAEDGR